MSICYIVEQANLPQDITVQFTGINFHFYFDKIENVSSILELYIKNKEHVHAALELIEVSMRTETCLYYIETKKII